MFPWPEDADTPSERLLLTLFYAGAMAQEDLAAVLGWDNKKVSRVIVSLNQGKERIGKLRERVGIRNSGQIRMLTRHGDAMVQALIGQSIVRPLLNEAEIRSAAHLSRYIVRLAKQTGGVNYCGPYLVPLYFPLEDIKPPSACIVQDYGYLWLEWVYKHMPTPMIQDRIDSWHRAHLKLSIMAATSVHRVVLLGQTLEVTERIKSLIGGQKKGMDMRCVSAESGPFDLLV